MMHVEHKTRIFRSTSSKHAEVSLWDYTNVYILVEKTVNREIRL